MSIDGSPQLPSSNATDNSGLAGTAVGSGATTGAAAPAEFRFGPDAPQWARGKSAGEVLALTETAYRALAAQQASTQTAPARPAFPSDDDFLLRPAEASRAAAQLTYAEQFAPALEGLTTQFVSTHRALAEQRYADDFKRWGPEIEGWMQKVPVAQRTLENYGEVINLVRGKHVQELAEERARQIVAQGGVGERSGGGGGGTPTGGTGLNLANLPNGLAQVAQRVGFTEQMVLDYCRTTGTKPEDWMRDALDNKVVSSTGPFAFEVNDAALKVNRDFGA